MSQITSRNIDKIARRVGIAGQLQFDAEVTYSFDDAPDEHSLVTFVGSTFGGPVVMVTPDNPRGTFVSEPDRFGEFGEDWVRRFFAPEEAEVTS